MKCWNNGRLLRAMCLLLLVAVAAGCGKESRQATETTVAVKNGWEDDYRV